MKNIDLSRVNGLVRNFLHSDTLSKKRAILVRCCESQGNLAGTISGWTDTKLTDYGRRQAFTLYKIYEANMSLID